MTYSRYLRLVPLLLMLLPCGCGNNPYRPGETEEDTYFSSFSRAPERLDPTRSYWTHEALIIDQVYEPPFEYHFLKRPYQIIPLTAKTIPEPAYFDKKGKPLLEKDPPADIIGRVEYIIKIKPGIMYQDHPCFAKDDAGNPVYADVTAEDIKDFDLPYDFEHKDTRELEAKDYVLQIKRLADPSLSCPIYSTIKNYMVGFEELHDTYAAMLETERATRKTAAGAGYNQEKDETDNPFLLDYQGADFEGAQVVDKYTYKIVLKSKYPQMLYWMSMHFFGPMPIEALQFHAQTAMIDKHIVINRCPVGTGPYVLTRFQPNEVIEMTRNSNYHEDYYPTEGMPGDAEAGHLDDAGKRLPLINKQVYRMEKVAMSRWRKFIQGYYDGSAIASDVFDAAINMQMGEEARLSEEMIEKGIKLTTTIRPVLYYTQFNMQDDLVGGYSEKQCKLRQAISIAVDHNEYLDIFDNGRGVLGQGPIPPGLFGYRDGAEGANPFTSDWDDVRKRHVRKPIEHAIQLMVEAGYPNGRTEDGTPLTLHYDHSSSGDPSFRAQFNWLQRKLKLIGVEIKERGTDLTRYRQKRRTGHWQVSRNGWVADYPDPENFLFLFYGPNGKVKSGGANSTNYDSKEYDKLFTKMESMQNGPERQAVIDKLMNIIQHDAPAVWDLHPVSFQLFHSWYKNNKPHDMSSNLLKFKSIDTELRTRSQADWNKPIRWPVYLLIALFLLATVPASIIIYRRERGL